MEIKKKFEIFKVILPPLWEGKYVKLYHEYCLLSLIIFILKIYRFYSYKFWLRQDMKWLSFSQNENNSQNIYIHINITL